MIEVVVDCPHCGARYRVEREHRSIVNPACGHGTIVTPTGHANIIQCACGTYLDDRHVDKDGIA